MPWPAKDVSSLRREFVELACQEGANRRSLCRRYEISPRVGYKWIDRFLADGLAGLEERSRRPDECGNTVDSSDIGSAVLVVSGQGADEHLNERTLVRE